MEYWNKHLAPETAEYLGLNWLLNREIWDLLIFLSENIEDYFYYACLVIDKICDKHNALKVVYAGSTREQSELLVIRRGS